MKSSWLAVGSAVAVFGALAALAADASPPNLHDIMKNVVAVQTQVVWDVGNVAQDDKGDPDPSKLKAADWAKASAAAAKVRQAALTLASAPKVLAAAPGQKLDGEGGSGGGFNAKQVQAVIDANPKVFQGFATALASNMADIEAAAKAKDAKKLFDASGAIDQVCEDCHKQFWYPNQK